MSYRFSDQNDPADFKSELIFDFLITKNFLKMSRGQSRSYYNGMNGMNGIKMSKQT